MNTSDFDLALEYLKLQREKEEEEKKQKDITRSKTKAQWNVIEKKRDPNPLVIWEAVNYCVSENKDFPGWVRNYLQKVARELLSIRDPGSRAANLIKDALGFQDGTTFNRHVQAEEKLQIFHRVEEDIRKRGGTDSIDEIFAEVAKTFKRFAPARGKYHYASETIKKFYYEIKQVQEGDSRGDRALPE